MTLAVLVTAVSVISIVLISSKLSFLKFFKKKEKQTKEVIDPPEKKEEMIEAASQFMVDKDAKPKEKKVVMKPKRVYRPGAQTEKEPMEVIDPISKDTEHFQGHEIEVKELPEPEHVEVDASWVEMDVTKDFKIIMKELKRKKVNCYEILNIKRNADTKTIHKAYRKLASQFHPDRGTSIVGMTKDQIMDKIREINYSKDILLNPTMRAFHDQAMREREKSEPVKVQPPKPELDESMLELIRDGEEFKEEPEDRTTIVIIDDDDEKTKKIGVLLFRKWDEDHEHFSAEFMDYMIQLDEQGYVDYGRMLKDEVDDIEDIYKLKKVSNYSQAVNNSLFEIWVRPPYHYMALPVLSREYVQEICDMLKDSFDLDSIFFTYP